VITEAIRLVVHACVLRHRDAGVNLGGNGLVAYYHVSGVGSNCCEVLGFILRMMVSLVQEALLTPLSVCIPRELLG